MRRWTLIVSALLVSACGGDRNAERPEAVARPDSLQIDSAPARGDSMMARDTASD